MATKWEIAQRMWPERLVLAAIRRAANECQRRRYVCREDAEAVMADLSSKRGHENRKLISRLNAYFCWPCGYWHVGHDLSQSKYRKSGIPVSKAGKSVGFHL